MKEYKVPVQSLIDHIKTAVDVDDWAKEMAEDLLKRCVPTNVNRMKDSVFSGFKVGDCPLCGKLIVSETSKPKCFCNFCGQAVKWE